VSNKKTREKKILPRGDPIHGKHFWLYQIMLYLTNNEDKPKSQWMRDEVHFDFGFFITGLISVIISFSLCIFAAFVYLSGREKEAWCIIFLVWALENSISSFIPLWDQIRHNRED
jgi:hypothetical protein